MYFKSRAEAGEKLAIELEKRYQGQPCAVVALSDGAVVVGVQIAMRLRCVLTMLLSEAIELPRENAAVGGITQEGAFTYNQAYSPGEIEDFVSEYRTFIEQEKMQKIQDMHRETGRGGALIRRDLLHDHNVILVSDGLPTGFSLDIAMEFLKPIQFKKLIIATPFASVPAVDRMHILGDDIYCLNVIEDYISTDHYYDVNDVPKHEAVVKTVEKVVARWK